MSDLTEFAEFYSIQASKVLRSVIATTGSRESAEDATAEAFQRAWSKWSLLRDHPAPAAWVCLTASNLIRDEWRKSQRGLRLLPRLSTSEGTHDPAPLDPRLLTYISRLPHRQREVLALRVLLDLSAEQTAQALNLSAGTVGTHLSRALATLRAELNPTFEQGQK